MGALVASTVLLSCGASNGRAYSHLRVPILNASPGSGWVGVFNDKTGDIYVHSTNAPTQHFRLGPDGSTIEWEPK
jgi:hypothetical protein